MEYALSFDCGSHKDFSSFYLALLMITFINTGVLGILWGSK